MYDDDPPSSLSPNSSTFNFYHPAPFPTRNITTPIFLLYGTNDSLVDMDIMLGQLPEGTVARGVDGYEHVDMIWGREVGKLVLPEVMRVLKGIGASGKGDDEDGEAGNASEEVDSDRLEE
jgi:lysosomal acid lipase/cholesteryl ester hydrolase